MPYFLLSAAGLGNVVSVGVPWELIMLVVEFYFDG